MHQRNVSYSREFLRSFVWRVSCVAELYLEVMNVPVSARVSAEVLKVPRDLWPKSCELDPYTSWLVKASVEALRRLLEGYYRMIVSFLRKEVSISFILVLGRALSLTGPEYK